MAAQVKDWKWWQYVLGGVGILALTFWEYFRLAAWERDGGTTYISLKLAFIYDALGKGGILGVGLVMGAFVVGVGLWELSSSGGGRKRA